MTRHPIGPKSTVMLASSGVQITIEDPDLIATLEDVLDLGLDYPGDLDPDWVRSLYQLSSVLELWRTL